jgi:hypothetical protein
MRDAEYPMYLDDVSDYVNLIRLELDFGEIFPEVPLSQLHPPVAYLVRALVLNKDCYDAPLIRTIIKGCKFQDDFIILSREAVFGPLPIPANHKLVSMYWLGF